MAKHRGGVRTTGEQASFSGRLAPGGERDRVALDKMVHVLYEDLQSLATIQRHRWIGDDTLEATALCHEAYLKLASSPRVAWTEPAHFLSIAARVMRQVLIDHERTRTRAKRGGDSGPTVSLAEIEALIPGAAGLHAEHREELEILRAGLRELERERPRYAEIIERQFFDGLTISETARSLHSSPSAVKRGRARAQKWLYGFMRDAGVEH